MVIAFLCVMMDYKKFLICCPQRAVIFVILDFFFYVGISEILSQSEKDELSCDYFCGTTVSELLLCSM